MPEPTTFLSVHIDRDAKHVYAYAADPRHLPDWAPGLGTAIDEVDGVWTVQTPAGPVVVSFAERNDFGVLDQWVTQPDGETVVYVPLRVTPDGDGCEVVFSLRRLPGVTDAALAGDAAAVQADLDRLKELLESS